MKNCLKLFHVFKEMEFQKQIRDCNKCIKLTTQYHYYGLNGAVWKCYICGNLEAMKKNE